MPKAANTAPETVFSVSLTVPTKFLKAIEASVAGDDPLPEKVARVAEDALLDLCEGGLMLNSLAVKKLAEAYGQRPDVETVIAQFSKGVGRVEGKLQITVGLPPETESMFQQIAEFQGVDIPQVLHDLWNTALDNGDFYDYRPYVQRVLMRNPDKEALVKLLGQDFETGTELAEAVKKYVAEQSPFAEVK